jgi:phosphonoacetaldehyde methylase
MQKRCIPPLGISYIASYLEKLGYTVSMLDCCVEGYDEEISEGNLITYGLTAPKLADRLKNINPDIVGISVPFSKDFITAINVANVVRNIYATVPIVIGGLHPTIYPRDINLIDNYQVVDYILRGEGELCFVNFLECLKTGKMNINGLVEVNGIIENAPCERISDLDNLPFPAFHLLPIERYFDINIPFSPVPRGDRVLPILTSRGCPMGCTFCASTNMYKKHHQRSVDNVMKEIKQRVDDYSIDEIQFADDNLTLNKKFFHGLLDELEKFGIQWCTPNGVMINTLTPDLITRMAKARMYQITLSVDSVDTNTLDLYNKKVDINRISSLIEAAENNNVFTHGTLVVGVPGETMESIRKSFDYVLKNYKFTSLSTFIVAPIPGSELYRQAIMNNLLDKKSAWLIDTTKSLISDLDHQMLESEVMSFQEEFTNRAKERNPEAYKRKYEKLINKGLLKDKFGGRLT